MTICMPRNDDQYKIPGIGILQANRQIVNVSVEIATSLALQQRRHSEGIYPRGNLPVGNTGYCEQIIRLRLPRRRRSLCAVGISSWYALTLLRDSSSPQKAGAFWGPRLGSLAMTICMPRNDDLSERNEYYNNRLVALLHLYNPSPAPAGALRCMDSVIQITDLDRISPLPKGAFALAMTI